MIQAYISGCLICFKSDYLLGVFGVAGLVRTDVRRGEQLGVDSDFVFGTVLTTLTLDFLGVLGVVDFPLPGDAGRW